MSLYAQRMLARDVRRQEDEVAAAHRALSLYTVKFMEKDRTSACLGRGDIDAAFLEQLAYNEKMAELGRLSVGVIHEVNTPLSVIVSAAQMILREKDLSPFVSEMVDRIGREAQRLSQLTRGITTFARKDDTSDSETDVSQCLSEVAILLKYEIQKRSVRLLQELDFDAPSLVIDGNRLKQVFINLIMNALQAMEDGGTLRLTTAVDSGNMIIGIEDSGTGIPPEKLEKIFEPFYTTKGVGEGTGLGLYVTRNIIEEMGGEINVSSVVGAGTTFTIRLPGGGVSP